MAERKDEWMFTEGEVRWKRMDVYSPSPHLLSFLQRFGYLVLKIWKKSPQIIQVKFARLSMPIKHGLMRINQSKHTFESTFKFQVPMIASNCFELLQNSNSISKSEQRQMVFELKSRYFSSFLHCILHHLTRNIITLHLTLHPKKLDQRGVNEEW